MHPLDERLVYRDGETFLNRPLSPAAVYILAEGTREEVEPLRPREAFLELGPVYAADAHGHALGHGDGPGAFSPVRRLAQCVPVRRLTRRMHLESLSGVRLAVEDDLSALLADEAPSGRPGARPGVGSLDDPDVRRLPTPGGSGRQQAGAGAPPSRESRPDLFRGGPNS